jgi:type IV pilus assembly protein PilO
MKSNKYPFLFLIALSVGLAGVLALTFAQAEQERAATLAQIAAKQRAIAQMRQATAGIEEVHAKVANLSRAVSLVESRLVPERSLDRAVKDIWQMADADSLQTQAIQPLAIVRRGNCGEQPVELKLTGDFRAFYAFMLQLEKMPQLLHVTHMELQRLPDTNGGMAARLIVGIFYQPETGETASATPP